MKDWYSAVVEAFLIGILSSAAFAGVVFLARSLLIVRRPRKLGDLAGEWIEHNTTIDHNGSVTGHEERLSFRRLRFTRYLSGKGERLTPPDQTAMTWRYLIRTSEAFVQGIYFRTDVFNPFQCGTVLLRRHDDNSWRGVFSRPTEVADWSAVDPVEICDGWMTSPVSWYRAPER